MSEAMKSMIEAMAGELVRQSTAGELIPMHAAVISRRDGPDGGYATGGVSSIYLMGRFDLEKVARAAIGTMREPTAEMLAAANFAYDESPMAAFSDSDEAMADAVRAMIDEALR